MWSSLPEGPLVLVEGVMEMRILKRQGVSVREIAWRTGHSRNTVERHLKREGDAVYTPGPRCRASWMPTRFSCRSV